MNKRGKIILSLGVVLLLFLASGFFILRSITDWRWNNAVSAAGAMPFQLGLTKVTMVKCFTTAPPPKCNGGSLCNAVDFASCSLYAEYYGMSAGGSGQQPLLLSQVATQQAGLAPGGQLIYGGTANSMFISPNSVLASSRGCYGCMAKNNMADKFFAWLEKLDKYIIAGFRDK